MKRRLSYLACFLGLLAGIALMIHLKLDLASLPLSPSKNCYIFEGDIDGERYYEPRTHKRQLPPQLPAYFECMSIRSVCLDGSQFYFLRNSTCYHLNLETDEILTIENLPPYLSWEETATFFKRQKQARRSS